MTSDTIDVESAELVERLNSRPGTRNLITSSGESRSQLYRRLKLEMVWNQAEDVKEAERQRCRAAGMSKTAAGQSAWDAVARAYPPVDAVTWDKLLTAAYSPPDVSLESPELSLAWWGALTLAGYLALRCPELRLASVPLLEAIAHRRSVEGSVACTLDDAEKLRLAEAMLPQPKSVVEEARSVFQNYSTTALPHSVSVGDELFKSIDLLDLLPKLIDRQWERTIAWACGPQDLQVRKYLLRVRATAGGC